MVNNKLIILNTKNHQNLRSPGPKLIPAGGSWSHRNPGTISGWMLKIKRDVYTCVYIYINKYKPLKVDGLETQR